MNSIIKPVSSMIELGHFRNCLKRKFCVVSMTSNALLSNAKKIVGGAEMICGRRRMITMQLNGNKLISLK